jgi:hypothetical protein
MVEWLFRKSASLQIYRREISQLKRSLISGCSSCFSIGEDLYRGRYPVFRGIELESKRAICTFSNVSAQRLDESRDRSSLN